MLWEKEGIMTRFTYQPGLVQVSSQTFAYLQPDGGWGWSNSGLIVGKRDAVLVDTLFDLRLTRRMLDDMQAVLSGPIRRLVNTHHNGDHCYGNELLPEAEIIAHRACREEMLKISPGVIVSLMQAFGDTLAGRYVRECFQAFEFSNITLTPPTTVFDTSLTVYVDANPVELLYLGPAHTRGDIAVYYPAEGVVFSGDLVFHLCTPIIWEGTCAQWLKALDVLLDLDVEHVVPGHGPLADKAGVQLQKDYLLYVWDRAHELYERGVPVEEAIPKIDLGPYAAWGEAERLAANVLRFYQEFAGADEVELNYLEVFQRMAKLYYAKNG
jgi:glyoxylase-like metal-dependent hydrolase (beta-lactamase superfamily II)